MQREIKTAQELLEMPVSTLAYLGDSLYELAVRSHLLAVRRGASGALTRQAHRLVAARAQAKAMRAIYEELSPAEQELVRRARNHVPHSFPRHSDPVDYRYATALEALLAWLWLQGEDERVEELMQHMISLLEDPDLDSAGTGPEEIRTDRRSRKIEICNRNSYGNP